MTTKAKLTQLSIADAETLFDARTSGDLSAPYMIPIPGTTGYWCEGRRASRVACITKYIRFGAEMMFKATSPTWSFTNYVPADTEVGRG